MTNRKERRAAVKKAKKLPDMPNISGSDENCANCHFSADPERVKAITVILSTREMAAGRPAPQAPPADEVYCLAEPQERTKKTFGWCGKWAAR